MYKSRTSGLYIESTKGATLFPNRGSYEYDQIRVSLCLLCLVFLDLLSCIESCFSLSFGLFVSTLSKQLAGKTILSWYLSCQRVSPTKTRL